MFLIDTHVHTAETSSCAKTKAREMVRLYREAGYHAIIITDHYNEDYFLDSNNHNWHSKIEQFLSGYYHACEEGDRLGLKVFLGMEIRFRENSNDYLVYGVDETYLRSSPKLYRMGLKEFKRQIDEENYLIIQAHPFRDNMKLASPEDIHGIEVYNGNCRQNSRNEQALAYAKKHSLIMSSGSDFHEPEDLARGGIILDHEINSIQDFIEVLKNQTDLKLLST